MLSWRSKRRISYIALLLIFIIIIGALFYFFYRPDPSCFDNKKNGTETGFDCGGDCVRVCTQTLIPLKILWVRPMLVTTDTYSVASLIENPNLKVGIKELSYTIHLTNDVGEIITSRSAVATVLPEERFIIFESNIITTEPVRQAFIVLSDDPYWQNLSADKPLIRISQQQLTQNPRPRLEALIRNETVSDLSNVEVVVVLSGSDGNAFAASRTVVNVLPHLSSQNIFFTWPNLFSTEPVLIDFYPRVLNSQ